MKRDSTTNRPNDVEREGKGKKKKKASAGQGPNWMKKSGMLSQRASGLSYANSRE